MSRAVQMKISEVASVVDGTLLGDSDVVVTGVCPLEDPQPGCVTYCSAKEVRNIVRKVSASSLAAVLIGESVSDDILGDSKIPLIRVKDPQRALLKLVALFHPRENLPTGISPHAVVAESARIGNNVAIAPLVVIGEDVVIGDDVQIHPHTVVYSNVTIGRGSVIHAGAIIRENCIIGEDCVVQNGAIVGADGFGYIPGPGGSLENVPQVGNVILSNRVEIGANACVDRATMGSTRIGLHSKVDNLVQIGHNVQIGVSCILCGQVGIGGSTKLGNGVVLGGRTGVADHLTIADGVRTGGNSGIEGDIPERGDYMGFPLLTASKWRRYRARFSILPDLLRSHSFKIKKDQESI